MAVAMEYCDSLDDAEDVVQETFRRMADGLPGFDSGLPFASVVSSGSHTSSPERAGWRSVTFHSIRVLSPHGPPR
jgi:hypothetical protein